MSWASCMWASIQPSAKGTSVRPQLSDHMWMLVKSMAARKWLGRKSCPVSRHHSWLLGTGFTLQQGAR